MKSEEQARSLFWISLSDRPKWQQFLICSSGFFFGYLVNGICEVGLVSFLPLTGFVLHLFILFIFSIGVCVGTCGCLEFGFDEFVLISVGR